MKEEAISVARRLMEDFPKSTDAMGLMGTVHMRFRDTAEAAKWWQKCIEQNPRRADAYHGLARIAYTKGEHAKALELWHQAQQINPSLPGTYGAAAQALLETGRPQEAIESLEKEIRLSPADDANYYLLGQAYLQLKQYETAAENYQKAIEIAPTDSRAYYGLASTYARRGQADKARQCMEEFKTIKAHEEESALKRLRGADDRTWAGRILAQTHADAGNLCAMHRRPKEAEDHWRRAAALDPGNRACRQALIDLYRTSGRPREAVAIGEHLRQIDPGNPTYHLNAGTVYAELQQFDAAEEAIRKAIELKPNLAVGHRSLVRILLIRNRKLPEAKALAQKLVELEPSAPNYSLLAEACHRNGDVAGAREALRRALELEPGNTKTNKGAKEPAQQK